MLSALDDIKLLLCISLNKQKRMLMEEKTEVTTCLLYLVNLGLTNTFEIYEARPTKIIFGFAKSEL